MIFIYITFGLLLITCSILKYRFWEGKASFPDQQSKTLFRKYLIGYLLFKFADWCQGPYFYEVYKNKDISMDPDSNLIIALLLLSGFFSSMIFGTMVGGFVDRIGRKNGCLLYCIFYIIASLSTHAQNIVLLFGGRICGGIATSLLFSAPESWLMAEYHSNGLSQDVLSTILGWSYFLDGCVAIIAGLCAQLARFLLDFSGPFDLSALVLTIAFYYVFNSWTENFGDKHSVGIENFREGFKVVKNTNVYVLGLIQSLFEGSMYVFVLLWVPVLSDTYLFLSDFEDLPTGIIFSIFMTGCMIGSTLFSYVRSKINNIFSSSRFLLLASCGAMSVAVFLYTVFHPTLLAFILFEICVGLYYPSISLMRNVIIPEKVRSTVMNFYRIPLNLFVTVVFLMIDKLNFAGALFISASALAVAAFLQNFLYHQNLTSSNISETDKLLETEA